MLKKLTKNFNEFVNESESKNLGLPVDIFMNLFKKLVKECPNLDGVSYPMDTVGHASKAVYIINPNSTRHKPRVDKDKALEEINSELTELADRSKSQAAFYIWSITTKQYSAETSKRLKEVGMENSQNLSLPSVINFLRENPDIAEKIDFIKVAIDSDEVRGHGENMASGQLGSLD